MATRKIKVRYEESGNSGTQISSGHITGEEYNKDLRGMRGLKEYDKMRRNDTTVSMGLWAVKYPIISADWNIVPASDDDADVKVADKLKENLFEILKFKHALEEILTCLDFGYSVLEMVLSPQEIDGNLSIALTKLAYRKQTSIYSWETPEGQPGITQYTTKGIKATDAAKLARFTFRQEGDNYEGISALRPAYKHWFYKDKFYKIEAIGYERQAVGVPTAAFPPGALKRDKDDLKKLLRQLRANQEGYLMYPQGWEVGFANMQGGSTKDTKPGTEHHDVQILKGFFAQFMALGSTQSGSRAVSSDHSDFFMLGVNAVADMVQEVFNDVIIKTWADLNYSNLDKYPRIEHGEIGDSNLPVISAAIATFVGSNLIKPRPEDENTARKMVGMAELSKEEVAERKSQADALQEKLAENPATSPPDLAQTDQTTPPKDKAKKSKDELNASALMDEARALHAKLTRHLYATTQQAA